MNKLNDTTFKRDILEVENEIGDAKQTEFFPQIKVKKWDNEVNFSVRYITENNDHELVQEDERIKYIQQKQEVHFYPTTHNLKDEFLAIKTEHKLNEEVTLESEPFIHLKSDGNIISRDTEGEREIRKSIASKMSGNVLIVGLGLGVINEYLSHATNVTVIEINQSVIDLIQKEYPERLKNVTVICDDFYNFVKNTKTKFNSIYGDIFAFTKPGDIASYEKFEEAAKTILSKNGYIDGRAKEAYKAFVENSQEDHGTEFEVHLKEKPDTNVFKFSIRTKGLKFYYQPELTEEEIKNGDNRPESVVGSYAVYHESKRDNNYQTGKVAHIYRPKIIDANGDWCWGVLSINEEQEELLITVPQEFLDTKQYPIIVDPTFGYNTAGGTNGSVASATIFALQTNNTSGADAGDKFAQYITVYKSGNSVLNCKGALYDSSNNFITGSGTYEKTDTLAAFMVFQFVNPLALSASTVYKLAIWSTISKSTLQIKWDVGAAASGSTQTIAYVAGVGGWPNPYVPVDDTKIYSIFVTYGYIPSFKVRSNRPNLFSPGTAR